MAIWIRTVDPQWFDFVSSRPEMAEVNLWTPAGRRFLNGAEPGDPVLFRVKGRRGVAGYGLFFNAAIYFAADAWDIFGEGNGADTREAFGEQIRARHTARGRGSILSVAMTSWNRCISPIGGAGCQTMPCWIFPPGPSTRIASTAS